MVHSPLPDEDGNPFGTKLLTCKTKRRVVVSRQSYPNGNSLCHNQLWDELGDALRCIGKGCMSFETCTVCSDRHGHPAHALAVFLMAARGCKAVGRHTPLMFASDNARVDSNKATIDLHRWSCQCRTALLNAERADIALLRCAYVLESSRRSALGLEADDGSQSVAKVSLRAFSTGGGSGPGWKSKS